MVMSIVLLLNMTLILIPNKRANLIHPIFEYGVGRNTRPSLYNGLISFWALNEFSAGSSAVTRRDKWSTNNLTDFNTVPSTLDSFGQVSNQTRANSEWFTSSNSDLLPTTAFTYSVWCKKTAEASSNDVFYIGAENRIVCRTAAAGHLQMLISPEGSTFPFVGSSTGVFFVANGWGHLVYMYDGAQSTNLTKVRIFLNGTEVSNTSSGTIPTSVRTGGTEVRVGGGTAGALEGNLKHACLWHRTLTAKEIKTLYNGGVGLRWPW